MPGIQDSFYMRGVLDGYVVTNQDTPGSPNYYGYVNRQGVWYIMRETTAGDVRTYAYVRGETGYSTAWTDRATQTYGQFDAIFGTN